MKIVNGNIFTEDGVLKKENIFLKRDKIVKENEASNPNEIYDASECYVLPGLIDLHIHGAVGVDFSDGKPCDLDKIAKFLIGQGVTGFLGTSMSFSEKELNPLFENAFKYKEKQKKEKILSADLLGINMEGPFIAREKAGAQKKENIIKANSDMFERLWNKSHGNIRILDIAPEIEGAMQLIKRAAKVCVVSIAHTNSNYEMAKSAFEMGATHVTHIFNAMPPLGHREPGVVGAAIEKAKHVELICDGIHIHPSMVRNMFTLFGKERICLISDSMRAAGMKDGTYSLGGQDVKVENGKACLNDGTIAGSTISLNKCLKHAISFGIPIEEAIKAVTINPAKAIGVFEERGSLTPGKIADISIFDKNFDIVAVFKNGIQIV